MSDDAHWGRIFANLLTNALENEEKQLKQLTENAENLRQTVRSTYGYYESWLSVPLLKEALRDPGVPRIEWEQGKIDLRFVDETETHVLATFEIKFKDLRLEGRNLRDTIKDFAKQARESQLFKDVEHYVVLVLCGSRADLSGWTVDELSQFLQRESPVARLSQVSPPKLVTLNNEADRCLGVFPIQVMGS